MSANRRTLLRRAGIIGTGLLAGSGTLGPAAADSATAGHIDGTITDFGVPVADATVTLADGIDAHTATTDEDGSYEIDLEPGTYYHTVTADGYRGATSVVDVAADDPTTANVSLERAWGPGEGELEVFATEVGGGPTIPCDVTIYGDTQYDVTAPLGSVPDGERWNAGFAVAEGWWEVRVTNAEGYDDGYGKAYVAADETAVAVVELRDVDPSGESRELPDFGRFTGTVVGNDEEPIGDATVRADGTRVRTTEDGTFEVELEHGRHTVTVDAPGYESAAATVEVRFARETTGTVSLSSL
ncbi:carboxypeptidase regulatory-like domain-containing protein [Halopiger xanaduensis]|uniref:PEGA domain protein n=1 Tax=Halopiger xanaduensis (strain DSM 18323 / JCM 14033 / SH-6) TaxID=797210 RepID=F8D6B6_HALXS|nr:carboxypeptidase regulatory-like domain-containing protein [Halopiger xanaduensis]AEH35362.1 PEGA domain protein [Halopiger xanaduensis SH-6]